MPANDQFTNWHATDWEALARVWNGLVGTADVPIESHEPTFEEKPVTSQQAGYVFQTWIVEALRMSKAEIEGPYNIPTDPGADDRTQHQLDGLLTIGWQGFLIESKLERVDFTPIARLHLLAESRPIGTMGLLFAARGFTGPALDSAHVLRPIRVLLFDGNDIAFALTKRDLAAAVRIKWKGVVKYGRANVPIAGLWREDESK